MEEKKYEILAEKKFKSRVVSETVYGLNADYGVRENTMRLVRNGRALAIEWVVGSEAEPIDEAEIGVVIAGKKVIDYDGVFEIPKEALELLKEYGLDVSEVEV